MNRAITNLPSCSLNGLGRRRNSRFVQIGKSLESSTQIATAPHGNEPDVDEERQRIVEDLAGLLEGDLDCRPVTSAVYASDASIYQITPLGVERALQRLGSAPARSQDNDADAGVRVNRMREWLARRDNLRS